MTALPEVLTVDQVAQLLDCTGDTVGARTRERRLPGLQYGRSWIYPRDALLEVLRVQALAHVQPAAPASPAPAPAAPKVMPMASRPASSGTQRPRGRTPAPLPDPPVVAA